MSSVVQLPDLISETEAYERYGKYLEDKKLRRAREAGEIGYYKKKGKIQYREDELVAFIDADLKRMYVKPCLKKSPSSDSDDTGSTECQDQPGSIVSGMTPELEKQGAALLRQQTSKKPKSRSRRSSSKKVTLKLLSQKT